MPLDITIKKVLVIGSGPIIIGQAAEFDYAGTQACRALKEEGLEVVLVNSNPATIMTDRDIAHRTYLEPLCPESLAAIIERERPDGLLATLGGQTGLNLAVALTENGTLRDFNVKILGTNLRAIKTSEDRDLFKTAMLEINQPLANSIVANSIREAENFAEQNGLPLIIRPAFTLGGSGGGIAANIDELRQYVSSGLEQSPIKQVLVEENLTGWKEIEYEIIRDSAGTTISICNMENIDPVGVHTGDSIVVAPSQTLSDSDYQALRSASLQIAERLDIIGGCNVQFALNQKTRQWRVIEVNPRVSRSSALASKATGYPIARVATKIALGYLLDEIKNPVTGGTTACFEPALDYVIVKIPRWSFDKFLTAHRNLGTQMKATGEVMAIGRNFETALLKAVRSLETGHFHLFDREIALLTDEKLLELITVPSDMRLFCVAEALRRDILATTIAELSGYDLFFCEHIKLITDIEKELTTNPSAATIEQARRKGFTIQAIDLFCGKEHVDKIKTVGQAAFRLVDTCAGEFPAATPFFYSTYGEKDESRTTKNSYAVIGSGPIRIGQGVEFDCCCVEAAAAIKKESLTSVMINNNPETVSTDADISDRLYFEPLTAEDIINIDAIEQFAGVFVQFGGQTPLNLAKSLEEMRMPIVGTSLRSIERTEDRADCEAMLEKLGIPRPLGKTATSANEALIIAQELGFPVLIRPSFVLGGRGMRIARTSEEAKIFLQEAEKVAAGKAILVDSYLEGTELEIDLISDGHAVLIPGIIQHIERAGVHSGDSHGLWPARLPARLKNEILEYAQKIAVELNVKGLLNIQFVVHAGKILILEINPRASRTVPFLTKVSGIPLVECAVKISLGSSLAALGYGTGLMPEPKWSAVKAPVFSFAKLTQADTGLDPEMKSTGEAIGIGDNRHLAMLKAMCAAGCKIPRQGGILIMLADRDKHAAASLSRRFTTLGYDIWATTGTAKTLGDHGIPVRVARKLSEPGLDTLDLLSSRRIGMIVNTVSEGQQPLRDGFRIRRAAAECGVPCLTALDTARAMLAALEETKRNPEWITQVVALQDLVN
jgi:carbamoyl-phosphate synthase large subunit